MKRQLKLGLVAGLLGASCILAIAKNHEGAPGDRMFRMNAAQIQDHFAKRMANLKTKLNITSAQESAWNQYVQAITPVIDDKKIEEEKAAHEAMKKMTTPQRLDAMKEKHAQRQQTMEKHAQATKTFYAALTPEQQKTFDTQGQDFMHDKRHPMMKHHKGGQGMPDAPGGMGASDGGNRPPAKP